MRLVAIILLGVLLVAGCASPAQDAKPAALQDNATSTAANYTMANASVPKEELQNATMGAEHVHDLWGQKEEMVLFDDTVQAGPCEGPTDAALQTALTLAGEQEATSGCARFSFPEKTVVPEGTGEITVAVDASDALKAGGMELNFRNKAREALVDDTTNPVHTFHVNLTAADWDLPHATATTWIMYVQSTGKPLGVFDGAVKGRVIAHKIVGWKPILAVAHVDHWKLPHLHDFAAPGVMRLYDGPANVTNIDPSRFSGQNLPGTIQLKDIIAPGASHVTLVVDMKSTTCAPGVECHLVPLLVVGGFERERIGTLLNAEGARRIYDWKVPSEVPEDSVYANVSSTRIDPRIDGCAAGQDSTCGLASIAAGSATARILAVAWQGEVDLALLDQIAGPAK